MKNSKYILWVLGCTFVVVSGLYYFLQKSNVSDITTVEETKDPMVSITDQKPQEKTKTSISVAEINSNTKTDLLVNLKRVAEKEDYVAFAGLLAEVYEKKYEQEFEFAKVESDLYMLATTKYFDSGNYEKALEISTTVYTKVPYGWRFRYLRVLSLEKLGRSALESGSVDEAIEYASTILRMMFRIEGANLLADAYIRKIEIAISNGDKQKALSDYRQVVDFEVSEDRVEKLTKLKNQIDAL